MKKYALLDAILEAVSGLVFMAFIGLCIIVLLTGCTVVRYQSTERTLTVLDVHPGGESLVLDGVLTNIGRVSVNRDTSDSSSVVGAVVDAAVGL